MTIAENVALQLIEAIANCTPDNIAKAGKAKAEALKLTAPEQKIRDEAVATINSVSVQMEELKRAKDAHGLKAAEIASAQTTLDSRKSLLDGREERHAQAVAAFNTKQIAIAENEKKLLNWQSQLEANATAQKATEERLKTWEADLSEQASGFEQAQKLIKRK